MAKEIEIVFCNPGRQEQELSLFYTMRPIPIAEKYFAAVKECEEKRLGILDPDRMYNFPGCHRNEAWIVQELNICIDIINAYRPGTIMERAEIGMKQEHMNALHHYFEKLRGAVLKPGEFFVSAPREVQRALDKYNLLIHRYEDFMRHGKLKKRRAMAVLTFDTARPRYALADEDYAHFDPRFYFGSLLINYCELGKPILDFMYDGDEVIGDDNVRPLRYYSGDAMLQFSPTTPWLWSMYKKYTFSRWWDAHAAKLGKLGFKKNDPRNAIGHIRVGMLNRKKGVVKGLSDAEILALIGRHPYFKRIHCHS